MINTSAVHSREFESDMIPFCPVLHPTKKEFNDFKKYIEKIEKSYSSDYGMVKVYTLSFIYNNNSFLYFSSFLLFSFKIIGFYSIIIIIIIIQFYN